MSTFKPLKPITQGMWPRLDWCAFQLRGIRENGRINVLWLYGENFDGDLMWKEEGDNGGGRYVKNECKYTGTVFKDAADAKKKLGWLWEYHLEAIEEGMRLGVEFPEGYVQQFGLSVIAPDASDEPTEEQMRKYMSARSTG